MYLKREIKDKEGQFIIAIGDLDQTTVTLVNIYAPPESKKEFFKTLLDTVAMEAEGLSICGGDLNVVMNYNLDTTSLKRNKKSISKFVRDMWTEIGYIDVWRDLHPLQRDFSHYSETHHVYSRIDYFYLQREYINLVKECHMGVADLSDHNVIYLKLELKCRQRKTTWRLNAGILNNETVVKQIKTDIKNYLEDNNNEDTNQSIVWDALKAVIRGKLISVGSKQKKERIKQYQLHISELRKLEQRNKEKPDEATRQQLNQTKKKINNLLQNETETKARFLKQNYYESGPKATRLLARQIRKRQVELTVHKIRDPITNQIKYDPDEIENVFRDYYKGLYTQSDTPDPKEMKNLLEPLDMPSIGTKQNKCITARITPEEIRKTIKNLKSNKSPGSDGFPAEWYKKFEEELTPILYTTFNWILENKLTPPSWKEAIITVLPKPFKDKEFCQNYRPISILNIDYKIYTSIISNRLQTCISDLIDEDQTGFIKGRQTHDNIRRTLHIIQKIDQNKLPAALISLDAEKAFDRVNLEFLYLTLEKFGFNEESIQCIKSLYHQPTARIKVNGSLTDRLILERGTRQGCCLSPLLFALYIEPLAQMVRQDPAISGVDINEQKHVISLFTDDIMIYLINPKRNFEHLMKIFDQFGLYSGYKININKTQTLIFNCIPNQDLKKWKINWEATSLKYLGVNITKNLTKLYAKNYEQIDTNIRKDIDLWSTYPLGLSDRIHVIKMNILPRLLYIFLAIPANIPQAQFCKWDKLISRFIWGGDAQEYAMLLYNYQKQKEEWVYQT